MRKTKVVSFLIILTLILSFILTGCAGADDYARITNMDYLAIVVDEPGCEGKIVVKERITFDVHAASRANGFWELWRDLPESWTDGVHVHYKVNSVKQIMPDGSEVVWTESPQLYWDDYDYISPELGPGKWFHSPGPYNESRRLYECLLFYVDDLYREKVTFEIEYEMYNAVLKYNDCSDLYISMYSGETTKYLESFNAQILIPTKDMPAPGNYDFTTYGTIKGKIPVQESGSRNPGYYTFTMNLDQDDLKFTSYDEFLEFDLVAYGADKHKFADHAPNNDYTRDNVLDVIYEAQEEFHSEYERTQSLKVLLFIICIVAACAIVLGAVKKVSDFKKKNPAIDMTEFKGTYRDIPSDLDPKFAAALVFAKDKKQKDDSGVYSAILLNLARKQYIDLQEMPSKDVLITIKENNPVQSQNVQPTMVESPTLEKPTYGYTNTYQAQNNAPTYSANPGYPSYPTVYPNAPQYNQPVASKNPFGSMFERADLVQPQVAIETREPLTMCEDYYLKLIKRHAIDNCITMEILQRRITSDYDYTKAFSNNIQRSVIDIGVSQGYIQNAHWDTPKKEIKTFSEGCIGAGIFFLFVNLITMFMRIGLAYGGFIILGVSAIVTGAVLASQAHKYVALTEFGEQEYKKWRGLYNFLKSDTLIHEKTFIELPLWEKYLVYATAFDISDKVIAAIKIRCPEARTVEESRSIVYSSYSRSGRYRSSGRSFHSSVRHGSVRTYSGGGGSYGGGGFSRSYGGGGRGGGGGGGGH